MRKLKTKFVPHPTKKELLFYLQLGYCFYCGKPMRLTPSEVFEDTATYDHFIPQAAGGSNGYNLVLACHMCNHQKADRYPTKEENYKFRELKKIHKVLHNITKKGGPTGHYLRSVVNSYVGEQNNWSGYSKPRYLR